MTEPQAPTTRRFRILLNACLYAEDIDDAFWIVGHYFDQLSAEDIEPQSPFTTDWALRIFPDEGN